MLMTPQKKIMGLEIATVQSISAGKASSENKQLESLKQTMNHQKETSDIGPKFIKLDVYSVNVIVLSSASFADVPVLKIPLGIAVLIVDDQNHANIVLYGSSRCHRLSRSVIAAEVHPLVRTSDPAYMAYETLEELQGRQVTVEAFISSRTLFNVI